MSEDETIGVGDTVFFELGYDGVLPRWNFSEDSGATGVWSSATVQEILHDVNIGVLKLFDQKGVYYGLWEFPLKGHYSYSHGRYASRKKSSVISICLGQYVRAPRHLEEDALTRATKYVQRNFREWPFGKRLVSYQRKDQDGSLYLDFCWEESSSGPLICGG